MREDEDWSEKVKTKWHPPKGFFEQSAQAIAESLKQYSDSEAQAMDRLDFYVNRAGDRLRDPEKFEQAKIILRSLYNK